MHHSEEVSRNLRRQRPSVNVNRHHLSSMTMTPRERLRALLLERSVKRGDFILASGARSSYYVDCRIAATSAEGQALIGTLSLQAIRESGLRPDAIGGLTMGADPVAYAIAHASWRDGEPIDAFTVRKQPKEHGTGKRIEGNFGPGSRALVIEDVITSGGTALQACDAVEAEGGTVIGVLALIDRESGGRETIEARGYPVVTLFGISELLGDN